MSNSTSTPSIPPTSTAAAAPAATSSAASSSAAADSSAPASSPASAASTSSANAVSSSTAIPPSSSNVQSSFSSAAAPSSSSPVQISSSSTPEQQTSTPLTTTQAPSSTPPAATSEQPGSTATISGHETTIINTSVFTVTSEGGGQQPVTITQTSTGLATNGGTITTHSSSSTSTSNPSLVGNGKSSSHSGLSGGGKTAVEVVVPIVVVALLVLAGLFFWRKRKQRKDAEELRRKEVEEYGYNPNDDPTLPPTGAAGTTNGSDGPFEMREDGQGYRGWGATTLAGSSTGRKASTTLSGGLGNGYSEGTSPTHGPSDTRSGDPLVGSPTGRPLSEGSEALGAMGPNAATNRSGDVHRGPSNASSSYSAANRSDGSGEVGIPGGSYGAAQYYSGDNYGGPYGQTQYGSPPGGAAEVAGQPVIRDNLARRATRIENPSHFPTQASAGISQNF